MLQTLPHINEQLADATVEGRPCTSAAQLNGVLSSLNAQQKSELYGKLFRRINLNTATREEIILIHGMTDRRVHVFEEYRPYTSKEQFRREIGKYVDETEVARLEGYVTLD